MLKLLTHAYLISTKLHFNGTVCNIPESVGPVIIHPLWLAGLVYIKRSSNNPELMFARCWCKSENEHVFWMCEILNRYVTSSRYPFIINVWTQSLCYTSSPSLDVSTFPLWICSQAVEVPRGDSHFLRTHSAFLRHCPIPVNNIPALKNESHKNHYLTVQSKSLPSAIPLLLFSICPLSSTKTFVLAPSWCFQHFIGNCQMFYDNYCRQYTFTASLYVARSSTLTVSPWPHKNNEITLPQQRQ